MYSSALETMKFASFSMSNITDIWLRRPKWEADSLPILLAGVDLGRFVHMMLFPHPLMSYQIRLLGTLFSLGLPSHEDVPRDMENNAYAFFGERRGWGGGGG